MKRSFIREILESIDKETISFAGGLPDETLFPLEQLKKANIKAYDKPSNLQYTTSKGIVELREKIADFYNEDGFKTDADNILITSGSQQALYIIAKHFQDKSIVIEEPSYLGAVSAFTMNNLDMRPIALQTDGIDMFMFEKEYKKRGLAYLIPDFQNPMASLYSDAKRQSIAKIVLENGGYIIEDAPYNQLYFQEKSKSISSLVPSNSLHLGSFSKTLSPSLRLGWIRADKAIIHKLLHIKESIDLHSCSISQHTANHYLEDKQIYTKHLAKLRDSYKEKMEFFAQELKNSLPSFTFKKPKGGMFIYGSIKGVDTYELVRECIKEKVVFVPASEFYLGDKTSDEIRFNFTHSSKQNITDGIKKINTILSILTRK